MGSEGRRAMYRLVASMGAEMGRSNNANNNNNNSNSNCSSSSSQGGIEIVGGQEVMIVLGGKASCRRKFVVHVHLVDHEGRHVSNNNEELWIVATVAYAQDHTPVLPIPTLLDMTNNNQSHNHHQDGSSTSSTTSSTHKPQPFLAEPPLFTTFNGVEFPAEERPSRMVGGRASFKLALSLLSSKCDNRLFSVAFSPIFTPGSEPFCDPCYSRPIRSISRKRSGTCITALAAKSTSLCSSTSAKNCLGCTSTSPTTTDDLHRTLDKSSLSLGLSPADSGSPSSGISGGNTSPTTHPHQHHQQQQQLQIQQQQEYMGTLKSGCQPTSSSGPFRPYASVGPFSVPPALKRQEQHSHAIFERIFQVQSSACSSKQKLDAVIDGFCNNVAKKKMHGLASTPGDGSNFSLAKANDEVSLEEEERSLQILELRLQEVNRELERRKEELRQKRRRLLEDEARMHSILFQSSWIESLSGRFSL